MRLKSISFAVLLSLGFLSLAHISCKEDKKNITQTEVIFKKEGELQIYKTVTDSVIVALDIELAKTDYEIQTGLMYRDAMDTHQGMLFLFDNEIERYFFMKNTRIPLDIIYINADKKIVSFQKNATPFDERSLPSNAPAKYVLEINAGLVDAWAIAVGDRIEFTE
ncbi:DUF192 domain-containing protein [Mariniflexile ostreae]|uniref:DUF192 domain-containing protein n=1 Tax=Mariniflexile ostreae TaxID=1520892 RepID=A0ABV5F8S6_9FLAO